MENDPFSNGQGGAQLIYLSQSNWDIIMEGVDTVTGCGKSENNEMDASSWKEEYLFCLSYGRLSWACHILILEASAVLQLHGYHVWVSEGNHNNLTLEMGWEQIQNAIRALWERAMTLHVTPKVSLWGEPWKVVCLGDSCWRNTWSALHFCLSIISPPDWKLNK